MSFANNLKRLSEENGITFKAHVECNDCRHGFVMTKVYETEEMKISPQQPGNGFMKTTTKIEIFKDEPCQRCKHLNERDRRVNEKG